jgi:hypothetical protein
VVLRSVFVATVLGLTLFPTSRRPVSPAQDLPPVALWGRVDLVSGPNHTLLVLVDQGTPDSPPDGLVDLAFRLQHAPSVTFSGYATVAAVKNRVSVMVDDQIGWVFTVAGRTAPVLAAEVFLPHYDVLGLSRFWGTTVNLPPTALALQLLSGGTCGLGGSDGGVRCDSCEVGGPGFTSCSMPCGGGTCWAECADNQYACCNCPMGCGCCGKPSGGLPLNR